MKSEDKSEVFPCQGHDGLELELHPFLTFALDGSAYFTSLLLYPRDWTPVYFE
jgi:hypothetical protein